MHETTVFQNEIYSPYSFMRGELSQHEKVEMSSLARKNTVNSNQSADNSELESIKRTNLIVCQRRPFKLAENVEAKVNVFEDIEEIPQRYYF